MIKKQTIYVLISLGLFLYGTLSYAQGIWEGKTYPGIKSTTLSFSPSHFFLTNTGGTWTHPHNGLSFVSFINSKIGIAGGGEGVFITKDGGFTWKRLKPRGNWPYGKIIGEKNIWLVEGYQHHYLWHTTNGGKTWSQPEDLKGKITNYIADFYFKGNVGWILTSGWGPCFYTIDGGKTWQVTDVFNHLNIPGQTSISIPYRQIISIPSDTSLNNLKKGNYTIYMLGINTNTNPWNEVLIKSKNGGISWEKVNIGKISQSNVAMYFATNQIGWIGLNNGKILFTRNGGKTWEQEHLPINRNIVAMWFNKEGHGFVSIENWIYNTANRAVFETHDYGKSWAVVIKAVQINAFAGLKNGDLWAVGNTPSVVPQDVVAILQKPNINISQYEQTRYSTQGPVPIKYYMPYTGDATLVIEKPDGQVVKDLIGNYPRKKGWNTDYWNGTDNNGHLVSPGKYILKGLYHGKINLLYEFTYGNPGNPEYENATNTGGWLSNHTDPEFITSDKNMIYIACPFAEGATTVLAINYKGQRQWGIPNINGGMLAAHGKYVYMLVGGPTIAWGGPPGNDVAIVRINAKTGQYAVWPDGKSMDIIGKVPAKEKWWIPNKPEGQLVAEHGFNADWLHRQTLGLAYGNRIIYASLYYQNEIIKVNAKTGEVIGKIDIKKPAGLACNKRGQLYVISGKQVVKIAKGGEIIPVITEGLSAPVGLAIGPNRGRIYVSDWGKNMDVQEYNSTGLFLRRIGRKGGMRLTGRYDPKGMFRPVGITVDQKDRLWVAEYQDTPRRISVWNTDTGKLITEYDGTTGYAAIGANVDQENPDIAFVRGNICQLNWKKGQWRVIGTLFRRTKPNDILTTVRKRINVIKYKGRKILIAGNGYVTIICSLHKYYAVPLAAMGTVYGLYHYGEQWPSIILKHLTDTPQQLAQIEKQYPKAFNGIGSGYPDVSSMLSNPEVHSIFLWTREPDGKSKIRFYNPNKTNGISLTGTNWQAAFDKNLALYFISGKNIKGVSYVEVWKMPIVRWNKAEAPVYSIKTAKIIANIPSAGVPGFSVFWSTNKGKILIGGNPMMMVSAKGKILWTYPNKWPGVQGAYSGAPQSKRERLIGTLFVCGEQPVKNVGNIICIAGNEGERYLMTTDGLFIANLFKDFRRESQILPDEPERGMNLDNDSAGGEPFNGNFFIRNGKYYLEGPVDSCREASLIAKLTGLSTIRRMPAQDITYTSAEYQKAENLFNKKSIRLAQKKVITIKPIENSITGIPNYSIFNWSDSTSAKWSFDVFHSAQATWAYNNKNLYIAFMNIHGPYMDEMVNKGRSWKLFFKTGYSLAFELRTVPDNNTPEVIVGDERILFSIFHGKPIAVLYNYKVPGTKHPVPFSSPVGTYNIDQVRILKNAKIMFDRYPYGLNARIVIPLKDINFNPEIGKTYRGDFGIIYGNEIGNIDTLRMYWANKATTVVNDIFSEAQIQPQNWGKFVIK